MNRVRVGIPEYRVKIVSFFGLKGGVGKTTLSAAATVAALEAGLTTAVLDLDPSGGGLTTFVERRRQSGRPTPHVVTSPNHSFLNAANSRRATEEMDAAADQARAAGADCLLIDTSAGRDALWINAAAILACDVLVTPVSDSPLDLDLLFAGDANHSVVEFVQAAAGYRGRESFRWLVARNRGAHLRTRLSDRIAARLAAGAQTSGFRVVDGLTERVGYREMFEDGLSPLDSPRSNQALSLSALSARSEIRHFLAELGLEAGAGAPVWFRRVAAPDADAAHAN
jgi:chromosome partitioning protein